MQYINNSITNKLISCYGNFPTVRRIIHNGKNDDTHKKTLKTPEVTGICDPSKLHLPQIQEGKTLH